MNSISTMDKRLVYFVFLATLLWMVTDGVKFCRVSSDCVYGKRCCERLCLNRKACDGLCSSDLDCDKSYGESCSQGKCTCERPPCSMETKNPNKVQCTYDSECDKNQTCKDGVCQSLDSITKTETMNPVVLGVVATVGLIIFAGAFYLCLRKQTSSRPSLAAKQAKHHQQAMELERMNEQLDTKDKIENSNSKECHNSAKKHSNITKDFHKRPQGARGSLNELSVVLEEDLDEVSDVP